MELNVSKTYLPKDIPIEDIDKVILSDDCFGLVYLITNIITNYSYVGKAARDNVNSRLQRFINTSISYSGKKINEARKKYPSMKDWKYTVLVIGNNPDELLKLEYDSIIKYDTINNGYNSVNGTSIGKALKLPVKSYDKFEHLLEDWKILKKGLTKDNFIKLNVIDYEEIINPTEKIDCELYIYNLKNDGKIGITKYTNYLRISKHLKISVKEVKRCLIKNSNHLVKLDDLLDVIKDAIVKYDLYNFITDIATSSIKSNYFIL